MLGEPTIARALDALLAPLDAARAAALRALQPALTPWLRRRDLRVATAATGGLLVAFGAALWLPLWQLALGPIVWGVPHVLADLRYLVAHKRLHRDLGFWLLVAAPLAAYTRTLSLGAAALAVAGGALLGLARAAPAARRPRLPAALAALAAALALYASAALHPGAGHLALLHGHNLVALALWWRWRPRRAWEALPLALCAALSAALLFGWSAAEWRAGAEALLPAPAGLPLSYFCHTLARPLPAEWAPQAVALYAFLQSAHYVVWLRLIPEDSRPQETPISFRKSARALLDDLGAWPVALTLALALALLAYAAVDLKAARLDYLRWASSHALLELAVAAYLAASGRALRERR